MEREPEVTLKAGVEIDYVKHLQEGREPLCISREQMSEYRNRGPPYAFATNHPLVKLMATLHRLALAC